MTAAKAAGTSYAACKKDEQVSGGGFELLGPISPDTSYTLWASRPSLVEPGEEETYSAPRDGWNASGWAVTIASRPDQAVSFRSYAMCMVPSSNTEGQSVLEQANQNQELQQILQLLR